MLRPVSATTDSQHQFNFDSFAFKTSRLAGTRVLTLDKVLAADALNAGNREATGWGIASYKVPAPYLRPRVLNKGQPEPGKGTRFVTAPGDGPEHKFSKTSKDTVMKNASYGKEAKIPPVSYLPLKEWGAKDKRVQEKDKKAQTGRGTFIDSIFASAKKYNYPGPNKYFDSGKKDKGEGAKPKDTKKVERPNFLYDYEYLGLNTPGPGSYPVKDPWNVGEKKRVTSADAKGRPSTTAQEGKGKRGKGNGPGQYEITRLLTVREEKGKSGRAFVPIPVFERAKLGVINKVRVWSDR